MMVNNRAKSGPLTAAKEATLAAEMARLVGYLGALR